MEVRYRGRYGALYIFVKNKDFNFFKLKKFPGGKFGRVFRYWIALAGKTCPIMREMIHAISLAFLFFLLYWRSNMKTFSEELTAQRKSELENRLKRLRAETMITEVELAIFDGKRIRANGTRERVIGELLNGPTALPELAEKLGISRGNATATMRRLHDFGVAEIVDTEQRGHGSATNIWRLIRY